MRLAVKPADKGSVAKYGRYVLIGASRTVDFSAVFLGLFAALPVPGRRAEVIRTVACRI